MINNISEYFGNYFLLLGTNSNKIFLMIIFFLVASIIDLLGLGLVAPLIYSIISPETFNTRFSYDFITQDFYMLSHQNKVILIGLMLIIVYYMKAIIGFFIQKKIVSFSLYHQAFLINLLVKSYQSMHYSDLIQSNTSTFYNSIATHVRLYVEQTLMSSLRLISELLIILFILVYLSIISFYAVFILVILFSLLFILYDLIFKKKFLDAGKYTANAMSNILKLIKEALGSLKEIKILKREDFFNKRVINISRDYAKFSALEMSLRQLPRYILESAIVTFIVILAVYLIYSGRSSTESLSIIGVFGVASIRLLPSSYQLMVAISSMRFSAHHLYELSRDIKKYNKNGASKELRNNNYFKFKKLCLNSISYNYPNSEEVVLRDINLEINKGEFIGILGESGSGKTTLIDIILGLLIPNESQKILLNDKPLEEQVNYWHKIVAYIPQNIFLLDDTIKKNIVLEDNENLIDQKQLTIALRNNQLDEVIRKLEYGIETNIGDDGIKLSGGQRQRIILARASYHKKEVLIFDEATSSLDGETEKRVMDSIYKLKGVKTIIIISHNQNILNNCDKILQIKNKELNIL